TERGLYAVDNGSYRSREYDVGRGLPSEDVTSVAPAPDGVWVGTSRGLAVVGGDGEATAIGSRGVAVLSLLAVGDSLWVGGTTGLAWVDARTGAARVLTMPWDVPAAVRDVVVDRSMLWVATDSGLVRFDRVAARR